jgi:hypothetical protein
VNVDRSSEVLGRRMKLYSDETLAVGRDSVDLRTVENGRFAWQFGRLNTCGSLSRGGLNINISSIPRCAAVTP